MNHARSFLLVVLVSADSGAEVALENAGLEINRAPPASSGILLLEVLALAKLPSLDADKEQECGDENHSPLPADARVPEHDGVDDGDVQDGEDGDECAHDGEEQELVAPHVVEPLGEVLVGARLHHEEGAAHVNHLPREEDGEPGETGECGGTSAEHSVAAGVVALVTSGTQVAVAKAEHDDREGGETECGDPESVEDHVDHDFDGENTTLEL